MLNIQKKFVQYKKELCGTHKGIVLNIQRKYFEYTNEVC
jgi:hypothetical protein